MNFKEFRKQNKISQNEIAGKLGLTQSGYSKKENDPNSFYPSELKKIAKTYKLTIKEIYELFGIE